MTVARGDQQTSLGSDQHLVKICLTCGGSVWILVQQQQITSVLSGTCHCRLARVLFDLAQEDPPGFA